MDSSTEGAKSPCSVSSGTGDPVTPVTIETRTSQNRPLVGLPYDFYGPCKLTPTCFYKYYTCYAFEKCQSVLVKDMLRT